MSLMQAAGLSSLIVGVDRYSLREFPGTGAADVGGYLDPSSEVVASLEPTSIHSVGGSRRLAQLASALGAGYHRYSFDRLDDALAAMDTLSALYGCSFDSIRSGLRKTLDSAGRALPRGVTMAVIVSHEPGDASLTLAGRGTFIGDLLDSMGVEIAAPAGTYPTISVEGMVALSPEYIFEAFPGRSADSARITLAEKDFWASVGFDRSRVDCGFGDDLLVPGAGMASTARRMASGIRWN